MDWPSLAWKAHGFCQRLVSKRRNDRHDTVCLCKSLFGICGELMDLHELSVFSPDDLNSTRLGNCL